MIANPPNTTNSMKIFKLSLSISLSCESKLIGNKSGVIHDVNYIKKMYEDTIKILVKAKKEKLSKYF